MDKFEKKKILEEFLVKWKSGRAISSAMKILSEEYNPLDVEACRKIFERWIKSGKPWKDIDNIK